MNWPEAIVLLGLIAGVVIFLCCLIKSFKDYIPKE